MFVQLSSNNCLSQAQLRYLGNCEFPVTKMAEKCKNIDAKTAPKSNSINVSNF
jgi:hypothetical protein